MGTQIPVMISGTITDFSGRTLSGQTTEAFLTSIAHCPGLLIVGLNCALGAEHMRPFLSELSRKAPFYTSLYPNAGLPNEFGGYDELPEHTAGVIGDYVREGLLNLVGGCCGTTPLHISAIKQAVEGEKPRQLPRPAKGLKLSGLEPLHITENTNFVNIGERTNVAGSRKFARLIKNEEYEEALSIAREQVDGGAQVIDVNMDEGMLDSLKVMQKYLKLIASEPDISRLPLMVDSSKFEVLIGGLQCLQGKSIVNSISLKEGEEVFKQQAGEVLKYGAAVVVMAFDEEGQADTLQRRISICERAYHLLVDEVGFSSS